MTFLFAACEWGARRRHPRLASEYLRDAREGLVAMRWLEGQVHAWAALSGFVGEFIWIESWEDLLTWPQPTEIARLLVSRCDRAVAHRRALWRGPDVVDVASRDLYLTGPWPVVENMRGPSRLHALGQTVAALIGAARSSGVDVEAEAERSERGFVAMVELMLGESARRAA